MTRAGHVSHLKPKTSVNVQNVVETYNAPSSSLSSNITAFLTLQLLLLPVSSTGWECKEGYIFEEARTVK